MKAGTLARVTAVAWMLVAHSAQATSGFPDAIRRNVGLDAAPPCAYCHSGGVTGRGTVETPFGKSLRAGGLVAYDEASLQTALDRLKTEKVDSDQDGMDDIAELKAGTDPSQGSETVEPISYGCNVGRSNATLAKQPFGAMLAVALLLLLQRRRMRPPREASGTVPSRRNWSGGRIEDSVQPSPRTRSPMALYW